MEMYQNCKSTAQQGKQYWLLLNSWNLFVDAPFALVSDQKKNKKRSFPIPEVFLWPFFSKHDRHNEEIKQGRHDISANFIQFKLSHKKKQMANELLLL